MDRATPDTSPAKKPTPTLAVSNASPSNASASSSAPPDGAPPAQPQADLDTEFLDALLASLAGMAVRSPRRQADLAVALRRSGLDAQQDALGPALTQLEYDGCIEHLVPLADGGLLMSVTARGIERLSHTARRHVLDLAGK